MNNNNNTDKILALIDHLKYDVPYSGDVTEYVIVVLEGLVEEEETAPEGATHIDLDDPSESKWVKIDGDCYFYYNSGEEDNNWVWFDLDYAFFNINLKEL